MGKGDRKGLGIIPGHQEKTVLKKQNVLATIISGAFPLEIKKVPTITFYLIFFLGF